jgi:hypothetical protein
MQVSYGRHVSLEHAPVRCPLCHLLTGVEERFIVHEGDQMRVIVRCAGCRHRWSVIKLAAKGDAAPAQRSDS